MESLENEDQNIKAGACIAVGELQVRVKRFHCQKHGSQINKSSNLLKCSPMNFLLLLFENIKFPFLSFKYSSVLFYGKIEEIIIKGERGIYTLSSYFFANFFLNPIDNMLKYNPMHCEIF